MVERYRDPLAWLESATRDLVDWPDLLAKIEPTLERMRGGRRMKVLVCGGRDFSDVALIGKILGAVHTGPKGPVTCVVHGCAPGADTLAGDWARAAGVEERRHPADWGREGAAAGPLRNQRMCDERPDLVVAFPGGRGTADMTQRARAAGLLVAEITADGMSHWRFTVADEAWADQQLRDALASKARSTPPRSRLRVVQSPDEGSNG